MRCWICLDIDHAYEKRQFSSRQYIVNQPTFPTEGRKTNTRNVIESGKEAILFRPGHPYPFSWEHPSSCLMTVLLWGFTKKAVPERGPCPATRHGPWATCPLLIQQAVAAAADQRMILFAGHHELREMTKGKSTLVYKPIQRFQLQATLFLFRIIGHKRLYIQYNTDSERNRG